ncbi:MAG: hypothetical protein M3461_09685 [Pseudomonadota bacterium]|nr:hypothetical protein [Pseudomonadota bacterium]
MIADTPVWIDWLRGDESPPANLLQAELDAGATRCTRSPSSSRKSSRAHARQGTIMRLTVSFPGCAWTYLSMV